MFYQVNLDKALYLLECILHRHASKDSLTWLKNQLRRTSEENSDVLYFFTFGSIPRYFDKGPLKLTPDEINKAQSLRENWRLNHWSVDQTARTFLLLSLAHTNEKSFKKTFSKIYSAADIQELIALYQSLPLLPYPEDFLLQATDGIRSNMSSVFNAVALNNPYPSDYFNQHAWNQLVLKAFFIESDLHHIIGINTRTNPELAEMLMNYARERLAAKRTVKNDLWYLLGLSTKNLNGLKNALQSSNIHLQQGALLACHYCPLPEAKEVTVQYPHLQTSINPNLFDLKARFTMTSA